MAYQLQPGLAIVQNAGALPPVKATEEIFVYPQPSTLTVVMPSKHYVVWHRPIHGRKGFPSAIH